MGMVARCKEELNNCRDFCEFVAKIMTSNRLQRHRIFIECYKKCEKSYDRCLDNTKLGKLLKILA